MIRPYHIDDTQTLHNMLSVEGIEDSEMGFDKADTFVYDDNGVKGFYTYKIEHYGFPHLVHFCVERKSRGGSIARALISDFKKRMKGQGYVKSIVHAKSESIEKLLTKYTRTEPYAESNGLKFYLIGG